MITNNQINAIVIQNVFDMLDIYYETSNNSNKSS